MCIHLFSSIVVDTPTHQSHFICFVLFSDFRFTFSRLKRHTQNKKKKNSVNLRIRTCFRGKRAHKKGNDGEKCIHDAVKIILEMVDRMVAPMTRQCHVSSRSPPNSFEIVRFNAINFVSRQSMQTGLFIICNKSNTEDDFRETFEKFGKIEEIYCVKDRSTGENKGIVYIKYSKTSEAANALEEMNGKCLAVPTGSRPLKVLVASR